MGVLAVARVVLGSGDPGRSRWTTVPAGTPTGPLPLGARRRRRAARCARGCPGIALVGVVALLCRPPCPFRASRACRSATVVGVPRATRPCTTPHVPRLHRGHDARDRPRHRSRAPRRQPDGGCAEAVACPSSPGRRRRRAGGHRQYSHSGAGDALRATTRTAPGRSSAATATPSFGATTSRARRASRASPSPSCTPSRSRASSLAFATASLAESGVIAHPSSSSAGRPRREEASSARVAPAPPSAVAARVAPASAPALRLGR